MNPKPTLIAELIAEFLGTFVLILFGNGVVAMVVLFPTSNPGETIHGGFTNITLGWGLGGDHGHLHRWQNLWSAPQSRSDLGLRGLSRLFLAQGSALLHRANRRSLRRRSPRLLELSARVPPGRPATATTPPASSPPFPRFLACRRRVFSIK